MICCILICLFGSTIEFHPHKALLYRDVKMTILVDTSVCPHPLSTLSRVHVSLRTPARCERATNVVSPTVSPSCVLAILAFQFLFLSYFHLHFYPCNSSLSDLSSFLFYFRLFFVSLHSRIRLYSGSPKHSNDTRNFIYIYILYETLEQSIIQYINKPQYVSRPSVTLIVRLRLLSILCINFPLSVCLRLVSLVNYTFSGCFLILLL